MVSARFAVGEGLRWRWVWGVMVALMMWPTGCAKPREPRLAIWPNYTAPQLQLPSPAVGDPHMMVNVPSE